MVYGEGFVLEPLRKAAGSEAPPPEERPAAEPADDPEPPPAEDAVTAVADPAPASPPPEEEDGKVDYLTEVMPLFERTCFDCHGDKKRPKGRLKLSDMASVFARDSEEVAIVPGDPEASLVYVRITLPADHEDIMPPPDDEPLQPAEIALVRRWIEEGARWRESADDPLRVPTMPATASGLEEAPPVPAEGDGPKTGATEEEQASRDAALARLRGARARLRSSCGKAAMRSSSIWVSRTLRRATATSRSWPGSNRSSWSSRWRARRSATGDWPRSPDSGPCGDCGSTTRSSVTRGLAHVAGLPRLESLNLFATRVTDASLAALASFPRLARLYVGETGLGDGVLDDLQRRRPELTIERGDLPDLSVADDEPR